MAHLKSRRNWKLCILLFIPVLFYYDLFLLGKSTSNRSGWYQGMCGHFLHSKFESAGRPFALNADPGTTVIYNEPAFFLPGKQLREGKSILWSNKVALGSPVFAQNQGLMFPLNWIAILWPSAMGMEVLDLLKILLCYFSFFYLAFKVFKLSFFGSLVAAILYGLSGHTMVRINMNTATIYGLAPLHLAAIYFTHQGKSKKSVFALGLTSFSLLVAGFPPASLSVFYLGGLYHLYFIFHKNKDRLKQLVRCLVGYATGAALAAPQLLPFIQALRLSEHPEVNRRFHLTLEWPNLLYYLLFPFRESPHAPPIEPGWLGLIAVSLYLSTALLCLFKRHFRCLFLFVLPPFLYLSATLGIPIIGEFLHSLPYSHLTRLPRDFSVWLCLSVSGLVAVTLSKHWLKETSLKLILVVTSVGLLSLATLSFFPETAFNHTSGKWTATLVALLCIALFSTKDATKAVGLLTALSVFVLIHRVNLPTHAMDFSTPKPLVPFMKDHFKPHYRLIPGWPVARCTSILTATFGVPGFLNVDPLMPLYYTQHISSLFKCVDRKNCLYGMLGTKTKNKLLAWQLSGVKYHLWNFGEIDPNSIWSNHSNTLKSVYEYKEGDHQFTIFEDPKAFPKLVSSPGCKLFNKKRDLYRALTNMETLPNTVLIHGDQSLEDPVRKACTIQKAEIKEVPLEKYEDDLIVATTTSSSQMVVSLQDMIHPNWELTIDGKPSKQFATFGIFRGALVPAGTHVLKFQYRDKFLMTGGILFIVTLLIWSVLLFLDRKSDRSSLDGARPFFQ